MRGVESRSKLTEKGGMAEYICTGRKWIPTGMAEETGSRWMRGGRK